MSWKDTDDEHIKRLNVKHFVAKEGGKTRVYNEEYDDALQRNVLNNSSFDDFRNFYLNQYVEKSVIVNKRPVVKFVDVGDYWLRSIDRRQYSKIVFVPKDLKDDSIYNLWKGFAFEPSSEGSWILLQAHIRDNICNKDEEHFNYIMDWMAHAVQFPAQQANVAVVMKGARGTGKGTAIGYFAELFGQHYIHVFSSKQVTGNFNYHLRDAVILYSDEAVYAGNKAEESVLKGLITEPYIPLEGKYKDLIMIKNCLHVMISTNNQWAIPAGLDERRFFVLNVKDDPEIKQNTKYFNAIKLQMNNGGRGRMLFDLMNRDIAAFDNYTAPKTIGLLEQKIESFDPVQAWWYACLNNGYIFDGVPWDWYMPKEACYIDFVNKSRDTGHSKYRSGGISFGMQLRALLPDGWPKDHRTKANKWFYDNELMETETETKNHYQFPSLDECRVHFCKLIGHEINWPVTLTSVKKELDVI